MTLKKYLLLSLIFGAQPCLVNAQTMFVYVPTEVTAKTVQDEISQVCPEYDVTVFGRSKDLRTQIKKSVPDTVISLAPVLDSIPSFSIIASGMRGEESKEPYYLVSVDSELNMNDLKNMKVGVIDLLGRKPMEKFVSGHLKQDIKLKRVTKIEDLLSLLTFKSVSAIFVSESTLNSIKSKSNLELISLPLDVSLGLAAVASAPNAARTNDCLSKFSANLNSYLGVEKWSQK